MSFTRKIEGLATVAFVSLSLLACKPAKHTDIAAQPRGQVQNIVGGFEVKDTANNLPKSVVLLINIQNQEVCTATLISKNFALTAAHCLDTEDPGNLFVFFGSKPDSLSERRQVIKMKASPYWEARMSDEMNTGDIAIVKFEGSDLPKGFESSVFLDDDSVLKKNTYTVVFGFGINDPHTKTGAGVLRATHLQISDPDFSPTEVLLDQSKGKGVCHGDSGGPAYLYLTDKKGRGHFLLWGVANHSTGNNDEENLCDKGVVYTNAVLYRTWIRNTMMTL